MQQSQPNLFSDEPVDSDFNDRLSRTGFADRIAELLNGIANETASSTAGLIGAWGSGKTSVLNLLAARMESDDRWSVVKFNPWMTSDVSGLTLEFIITVQSALPPEESDARKRIGDYARRFAPFTSVVSLLGLDPSKALETFADMMSGNGTLEDERQRIESALRATKRKILVLIDDLDRLHADELTTLLKLVRLVGRLPNVYYVLAYDETTLLDVLSQSEVVGGNRRRALAYLDKIVQLRLDLPAVPEVLLDSLANEAFNMILSENHVELSDKDADRFFMTYQHARRVLDEPRLVKRYFGQVAAVFPLVAPEVDFVDFVFVTFIRTFFPEAYRRLPMYKAELTRPLAPSGAGSDRKSGLSELRSGLDKTTNDSDSFWGVLSQLFPDHRVHHSRAVADPEYFGRYFYLAISPEDVSDGDVEAVLHEATAGTLGASAERLIDRMADASDTIVAKLVRHEISDPKQARVLLLFAARVMAARSVTVGDHPSQELDDWIAVLFQVAELTNPSELLDAVVPVAGLATVTRGYRSRAEGVLGSVTDADTQFSSALAQRIEAELESRSTSALDAHDGTEQLLLDWAWIVDDPGIVGSWLRNKIDSDGPWTASDFALLAGERSQPTPPELSPSALKLAENLAGPLGIVANPTETVDAPDTVKASWAKREKRVRDALAQAIIQSPEKSS